MNKMTIRESELAYYLTAEEGVFCHRFTSCKSREKSVVCSCPLFAAGPPAAARCQSCFTCRPDLLVRQKSASSSSCHTPDRSGIFSPDVDNRLLESLAWSWLKKGRIQNPPVPVDLVTLFDDSCKINVRTLPLNNCHGAIWKTHDSWEIYINDRENPAEQRLTLFHEAFHILVHLRAAPVFKKPGEHDCLYNELLADSFAHKLLVPQKWLERDWIATRDPVALSQKFQVTEKALNIRLREAHLTTA